MLRRSFVRAALVVVNSAAIVAMLLAWSLGRSPLPVLMVLLLACVAASVVGGASLVTRRIRDVVFDDAAPPGERRRVAALLLIGGLVGTACFSLLIRLARLGGMAGALS